MTQLRPGTHSHLGWRPATGFGFARQVTLVPLASAEIARVAQALPVLFRKTDDRWQAVAVMGPVEGANVYVSREGKWRTSFVPALLRVYPFRLDAAGNLCLWHGFRPEPLAAEGAQPFYKDGELAPWLQQTLTFLRTVHASVGAVDRVLDGLEAIEALTLWEMPGIQTLPPGRALTGLHAIDASRFEVLEGVLVLELYRSGSLRWLHAHLDSLHHAERFKSLAKDIVEPPTIAPQAPEEAEEILAAIAEDLREAERQREADVYDR